MKDPLSTEQLVKSLRKGIKDRDRKIESQRQELVRLHGAAQKMIEAYQPHVMENRCRVCNMAWQELRAASPGVVRIDTGRPIPGQPR